MRNKYLSKLIVIEATLFKHEMTNGQEELKLNLIGLNIIIAVHIAMVVSRSGVVDLKSVFKKQSHDKGFEFQSIQFIGSL